MKHPAITRIATVLSWINAADLPESEIERSSRSAQEQADVRAIIDRVKELRRQSREPKANHWVTAREEFIERVLVESGLALRAESTPPEGQFFQPSEGGYGPNHR